LKAQWNLLPGSRKYAVLRHLNHLLNRWCVLAAARYLGFTGAGCVVWIYDTEAAEYLSAFPNNTVVYDCVDDHAAQSGVNRNAKQVEYEESRLLHRADLVTVTSERLFQLKSSSNSNTHLVLNAGDVELYTRPAPLEAQKKARLLLGSLQAPILGSVGALDSYKVDFDLIMSVAKQHPQWQFVFIGKPVVERRQPLVRLLSSLPNIHLLGPVDHTHVSAYVEYFTACLIPYRYNRYNAASFPLKFWEFMMSGKPIIACGVPELRRYDSFIHYTKNKQQFVAAVKDVLGKKDTTGKKRRNLAQHHSWQHRVKTLESLLFKTRKARGVRL
ncbi:MAG: glycosyltransferase, partial [Acidobacteriota bacterium]